MFLGQYSATIVISLISCFDAESIRSYQPPGDPSLYPTLIPKNLASPETKQKIMRILHTMLRVANLERSLSFYTEVLGMDLLRKIEYPEGEFTLAFLGYGDESSNTVLELTYNWGVESYEMGNAFGHIAIEVGDVYQATHQIRRLGGKVIRDAGPMNAGTTVISFIEDPDGYSIELIGTK